MKNPLKEADELFGEEINNNFLDLEVRKAGIVNNSWHGLLSILKKLKKRYIKDFGEDYENRKRNIGIEMNIFNSLGFKVRTGFLVGGGRYVSGDYGNRPKRITISYKVTESDSFLNNSYIFPENNRTGRVYHNLEDLIKVTKERVI